MLPVLVIHTRNGQNMWRIHTNLKHKTLERKRDGLFLYRVYNNNLYSYKCSTNLLPHSKKHEKKLNNFCTHIFCWCLMISVITFFFRFVLLCIGLSVRVVVTLSFNKHAHRVYSRPLFYILCVFFKITSCIVCICFSIFYLRFSFRFWYRFSCCCSVVICAGHNKSKRERNRPTSLTHSKSHSFSQSFSRQMYSACYSIYVAPNVCTNRCVLRRLVCMPSFFFSAFGIYYTLLLLLLCVFFCNILSSFYKWKWIHDRNLKMKKNTNAHCFFTHTHTKPTKFPSE